MNLKESKKARKNIIKFIILIICAVVVVLQWNEGKFNTPEEAVQYEAETVGIIDIIYTISDNENCGIYLFTDSDNKDNFGVAYVKEKRGKYTCLNQINESYINHLSDEHASKMYGDGLSEEIVFKLCADKKDIPAGYRSYKLKFDGSTYYFVYRLKEAKKHFGSVYTLTKDF